MLGRARPETSPVLATVSIIWAVRRSGGDTHKRLTAPLSHSRLIEELSDIRLQKFKPQ